MFLIFQDNVPYISGQCSLYFGTMFLTSRGTAVSGMQQDMILRTYIYGGTRAVWVFVAVVNFMRYVQ